MGKDISFQKISYRLKSSPCFFQKFFKILLETKKLLQQKNSKWLQYFFGKELRVDFLDSVILRYRTILYKILDKFERATYDQLLIEHGNVIMRIR